MSPPGPLACRSRAAALFAVCIACLVLATASRADIVRGTVLDEQGHPVFNADFNVYDPETGLKLPPSDKTDATGKYRLVLVAGRYDVLCRPVIGGALAPRVARGVLVNGTLALDFTLPAAAQVRGRVTDTRNPDVNSNGVYPVNLDFDRTEDGSRQPSQGNGTSPFGTFVTYIEGGSYTITANPDTSTGLAPARVYGWVVPTTDILQLPLQPAVYLNGFIRDTNGAPVEGAVLKFDDANDVRQPSSNHLSGADGAIRVGIAPGVYRVTVGPRAGTSHAAARVEGVDLTQTRTQNFTVAVGVVVNGVVTDKLGRPVSGADWDAAIEGGEGAATPGDNTGFDGHFRWVVAPGTYRLRLLPLASSGLDSVVFRNVAILRDTTIDVDYAALSGGGPGESPVVRFAPSPNPTHTTVGLTLVLRSAIHSALVEIYDVGGRRVQVLHSGPLAPGRHPLAWDGRRENGAQAHTGVYLVRARLDGHDQVTRFVLLP